MAQAARHPALDVLYCPATAKMPQAAQRPTLNITDAPEVGILTGRSVENRRWTTTARGRIVARRQPGRTNVAMPKLPEGFAVADLDPMASSDSDVDSHDPLAFLDSDAWMCPTCTLANHPEALACEACETPRPAGDIVVSIAAAGRRRAPTPGAAEPQEVGEAWPTLAESEDSWELCDVSSLASSWLDIGDADESIEEDGSATLVTGAGVSWTEPPPAPPSYAAMATKAGVVAAPAPRAPRPPPMTHAFRAEPRTKKKDTDAEEDVELDEVECRRLWPQRGATQRRRNRKR